VNIRMLMRALSIGCLVVWAGSISMASEMDGEVKLGYVITDETGNRGVYQPNFNLYEGVALSLTGFRYQFDNGFRARADLQNITLKNRNMRAGLSRSGLMGLDLAMSQYRRTYNFDGDRKTRRDRIGGQLWVMPIRYVKVFGGYTRVAKSGDIVELYNPGVTDAVRETDYTQNRYNVGAQALYRGSMVQVEYRASDFDDQLNGTNDRKTERYQVIAATPVPFYRNIRLNGGFQHYRNSIDPRARRLSANTVWGGGRLFIRGGYSVQYSFIFDRAENTGDLVATDNITQAVYAGKVWQGIGGVTAGYQYSVNDDYYDEAEANGFFASGWVTPHPAWNFKADFGTRKEEITSGTTLTGDQDFSRYSLTATYRHDPATVRVKFENRQRDHSDIGSSVDFRRVTSDIVYDRDIPGTVTGSYSFAQGEYENTGGEFEFVDHVLHGSWLSPEYRRFQGEVTATYYRSKQDLDVESFSIGLTGRYTFIPGYRFEVTYSAHNFDDLLYWDRQYYTANIVEMNLIKSLSQ
jgi:hypothetical protein